MSDSKLIIRDKEYILSKVELSWEIIEEDKRFLRFNLFADCDDLKKPGIAINCIDIEGLKSINDIEGIVFELSEEDEDPYNELNESVLVEPGNILELNYLFLKFGQISNGVIPVELRAVCNYGYEKDISVNGNLNAEISEL